MITLLVMITQVFDSITMLQLPIPFPLRTTNVYFVDDSPRTLIDTGIKTEASFEALRERREGFG
jgi:glyoxylase-like metal-dependent hydrolase (beta-lactamase superfamily II)